MKLLTKICTIIIILGGILLIVGMISGGKVYTSFRIGRPISWDITHTIGWDHTFWDAWNNTRHQINHVFDDIFHQFHRP